MFSSARSASGTRRITATRTASYDSGKPPQVRGLDRDYRYREYNYVPRDRYRHSRTVTIHQDDGSFRRIRRCD
jgi:hypothetical protein